MVKSHENRNPQGGQTRVGKRAAAIIPPRRFPPVGTPQFVALVAESGINR